MHQIRKLAINQIHTPSDTLRLVNNYFSYTQTESYPCRERRVFPEDQSIYKSVA